jgi:hypothetical protein
MLQRGTIPRKEIRDQQTLTRELEWLLLSYCFTGGEHHQRPGNYPGNRPAN